jgi:hypothetical protein
MKARPTVLGLMGVVACIAIGLAALRSNDEYSAAVVFALTYLILCTSTLVAIYRRGAWAGFAVFGWAQFLICQPNTAPPVGATSLSNGIAYSLLIRHHGTGQEIPPLSNPPPEFTKVMDVGEGKPILVSVTKQYNVHRGFIPVHCLRACLCLSSLLAGLLDAAIGGLRNYPRTAGTHFA